MSCRMEPSGPFGIGRGDLDPLAAGRGGGMLFDPGRIPGPGRPNPSAGLPGRLPLYGFNNNNNNNNNNTDNHHKYFQIISFYFNFIMIQKQL